MDYAKIYDRLVARARDRTIDEYTERHHVIPRCMGGTDDASNLVRLTAEEHFMAHKLLVKMHPGNLKLVFALQAMSMNKDGREATNKLFGMWRRMVSKATGDTLRGIPRPPHVAEASRAALKGIPLSQEHIDRIRATLTGRVKTPEHLAAIGAANKGRKSPMEGKAHSAETKELMRLAAQGRKHTPETIAKLNAGHAASTPEQRSARAHKAWETKRAKQLAEAA